MSQDVPVALTIGEVARQLQVPLHSAEYLVRSRGIQPVARAGNARLFSEAHVRLLRSVLDQRATGRRRVSHPHKQKSEVDE